MLQQLAQKARITQEKLHKKPQFVDGKHLTVGPLVTITVRGYHYRLVLICPPNYLGQSVHTLFLIDPFAPAEEAVQEAPADNISATRTSKRKRKTSQWCDEEEAVFIPWLQNERHFFELPKVEYVIKHNIPMWNEQKSGEDGTNCLVFCLVMMEFIAKFGRFPTYHDVNGSEEMDNVRDYYLSKILSYRDTT